MTVAVEPHDTLGTDVVIACLVTDKKYRKMGGNEGLKLAIKRRGGRDRVVISQILLEDLLKETYENDHFERACECDFDCERACFTDKLLKVLKRNLDLPCDAQVILIHKYSDYFKSQGILKDQVIKLRNWLSDCNFKVLDEPEKIDILSNRVQTGFLVREMCKLQGFESRGLQWPEFKLKWTEGEFEYPVIVKPVDACATDEAHWMTLINKKSSGFELSEGCLVQKFHEHFGLLYKVYVIGEIIEIVARPSITAKGSGEVMRFNTHKFKATEGDLSPEKMTEALERIETVRGLVEEFAKELKKKLQLTWFGIDVIIPEEGGLRAAVIDVNYMPGYDGIKDLPDKLIKAILD